MEYPKIETLFVRDDETHKVTDVIRNRVYGIIKTWHWTEKIDGTNIRLVWDKEKMTIAGRTDNASIPAKLIDYINSAVKLDYLKEAFANSTLVVYGEGFGAGIQRGGLYRLGITSWLEDDSGRRIENVEILDWVQTESEVRFKARLMDRKSITAVFRNVGDGYVWPSTDGIKEDTGYLKEQRKYGKHNRTRK